jgi:hypothetical protein
LTVYDAVRYDAAGLWGHRRKIMAKWGIPQLFAMWRRSVLFTVGAISLGAEELESQLGRLLKKKSDASERAPRVKVPVRAAAKPARVVAGRKPRAGRKVSVKRSGKL